jgi:hypothetical protein
VDDYIRRGAGNKKGRHNCKVGANTNFVCPGNCGKLITHTRVVDGKKLANHAARRQHIEKAYERMVSEKNLQLEHKLSERKNGEPLTRKEVKEVVKEVVKDVKDVKDVVKEVKEVKEEVKEVKDIVKEVVKDVVEVVEVVKEVNKVVDVKEVFKYGYAVEQRIAMRPDAVGKCPTTAIPGSAVVEQQPTTRRSHRRRPSPLHPPSHPLPLSPPPSLPCIASEKNAADEEFFDQLLSEIDRDRRMKIFVDEPEPAACAGDAALLVELCALCGIVA